MSNWFRANRSQLGLAGLALGVLLLLAVMTLSATPAAAAPQLQGDKPSDDTCLACHQQEGMTRSIWGTTCSTHHQCRKIRGLRPRNRKNCLCRLPYKHYRVSASRSDCEQLRAIFRWRCIPLVRNATLSNIKKHWIAFINKPWQLAIQMRLFAQTATTLTPKPASPIKSTGKLLLGARLGRSANLRQMPQHNL